MSQNGVPDFGIEYEPNDRTSQFQYLWLDILGLLEEMYKCCVFNVFEYINKYRHELTMPMDMKKKKKKQTKKTKKTKQKKHQQINKASLKHIWKKLFIAS